MDIREFRKYTEAKRRDEHNMSEAAKLIKMFETRCEELTDRLKKAVGWTEKEIIRKSLKTNQQLLEDAKKMFWGENL